MAANVEHQLVCKIIETQDFHTVEKLKIDEGFFLGDPNVVSQTREVFRFIRDHYHNEITYGSVPSWMLVQQRFYGFPWVASNDSLATLCQEVRRYKLRAQVMMLADELNQKADVDPATALNVIREAATTLSTQHELSNDMLLSAVGEKLYAEYQMVSQGQGLTGIPWPWAILNDDTQGIHDGQFIVIYGRPKSLKTWMALYIACHAYLAGQRVLIYSMEMTEHQILRRCACIVAQVDYDKFKKATLDPATQNRVWQVLWALRDEELAKMDGVGHAAAILASQPRSENAGISTLQAKIREFNPDLVIVDGMYLMKDDRQKSKTVDWKAISHISQDLKRTAAIFELPIIAVTQANRGATKNGKDADLAEIAYADALAQDCDLCMRVHKQKDTQANELELLLSFPGMREGTLDGFVIHGVPAVNFHFKRQSAIDPNAPPPPATQSSKKSNGQPQQPQMAIPTWRGPQ